MWAHLECCVQFSASKRMLRSLKELQEGSKAVKELENHRNTKVGCPSVRTPGLSNLEEAERRAGSLCSSLRRGSRGMWLGDGVADGSMGVAQNCAREGSNRILGRMFLL